MYDQDKHVVAYTSKTLAVPKLKYSDYEKALLASLGSKTFLNYIGGQKIIIETHLQAVTFLNI